VPEGKIRIPASDAGGFSAGSVRVVWHTETRAFRSGSSVESSISVRPAPKRSSESVHQDPPVAGVSDVSTAISASGPD
jgi:hypothetical protein